MSSAGRPARRRALALVAALAAACTSAPPGEPAFDWILRGGTVYDGSGGPPRVADVALLGERVAAVGNLMGARAARELDVRGLAVAPGFINMLSWATESLIVDGDSQSDIRQGVTLEVMGEGWSMGPLTDAMKEELGKTEGGPQYSVEWTGLMEYLEWLVQRGVSCNVASFVGATTLRIHEIGYADRCPTPAELERMRALLRREMERGALGLGSSLIYAPACYADTAELVALCEVVAEFGGMYITHMRSEGERLLEAIDEVVTIARESGVAAEIYHLKAAGRDNWDKLEPAIARIEAARAAGLAITADVYAYEAGATGLNAAMPPWVQEGGFRAWSDRLRDPGVRERLRAEITTPSAEWENLYLAAGSPEGILLVGFKNPELQKYTGRSLAEVAADLGTSPVDAMMDLVIEDDSRVEAIYFLMSEDNVRRKIAQPWVAFCSDAASLAPEGLFLRSHPHPRAYGNFARLLGRYVRDEGVMPLEEAVRRLTSFPADNLGIAERGRLVPGFFADVAVFDPREIRDHATFEEPHRFATGVQHVFVNGEIVLRDGEHTGRRPGRVVRGPGAGARRGAR